MVGRGGWCLLVAGFVISVSAFIAAQAGASARVAPWVLAEPTSGQIHPDPLLSEFISPDRLTAPETKAHHAPPTSAQRAGWPS